MGDTPRDESGVPNQDGQEPGNPPVNPDSQKVIDQIQAQEAEGEGKSPEEKAIGWGKIATGALTAIAGIAGSVYGPWVALAALVLGIVGFFVLKKAMKDWTFDNNKKKAGDVTGGNASEDQKKVDENRDAVDDFLGRDPRSGGDGKINS
jgi:cobalamin biosynthesis protein CobD/CbiB